MGGKWKRRQDPGGGEHYEVRINGMCVAAQVYLNIGGGWGGWVLGVGDLRRCKTLAGATRITERALVSYGKKFIKAGGGE